MPEYCMRMTTPKDCLDIAKPLFLDFFLSRKLLSKDRMKFRYDRSQPDKDYMYAIITTPQNKSRYLIKGAAAFIVVMKSWRKMPHIRLAYWKLSQDKKKEFEKMIQETDADIVDITPEIYHLSEA